MLTFRAAAQWYSGVRMLVWACLPGSVLIIQAAENNSPTNLAEVVAIQGTVEVARAGQTVWDPASAQWPYRQLHPGDQLRTKDHGRATIRLSDLTVIELGPNSHLQLLPLKQERHGFGLLRGLLYLFHRDQPGEYYFRTPTASPVIRGTELNLEVLEDGSSRLFLIDGAAALTNGWGEIVLEKGQGAAVDATGPPRRMASLETAQVIQWCLYYPAVLDLQELGLRAEEESMLSQSLAAYQQGNLIGALEAYDKSRASGSDRQTVYHASLLLASGEVSEAERKLAALQGDGSHLHRLVDALRTLIAAVKFQTLPEQSPTNGESLASELLARSYYQQSRFQLEAALVSARAAVAKAHRFGFAWARIAELELGFGRTRAALEALEHANQLTPRHAEALAIKGFVLAGQNRVREALTVFDEAVAADSRLGNAWLGRGLCRIRIGRAKEGLADLVIAASLEPNRALLRSYLGKALAEFDTDSRARAELERATQLDPNDPTAWLYSALLNQQGNRINDAIRDLERSEALNDNRQLYRSRLLLDQDRGVRQANLAAIYQDAGLVEQSTREGARAVITDYANHSAHLFLANSYARQRGLDFVNLRYETVTLSEYLVSQLLSPVGGNTLSPYVSQQEYSKLFESQGFGISSATEYLSRGDWQQRGAQYGRFGSFDYSLDTYYLSQNGERLNNDSELLNLSAAFRIQASPQDTLFFQAVRADFNSGDLRQYEDPAQADPGLRIRERQEPTVFAGYHHEWGPGSHTLLLGSYWNDDFQLSDARIFIPTLRRNPDTGVVQASLFPAFSMFSDRQHALFRAGSGELQQIWQTAANTLIVGGRYQEGESDTVVNLGKLPPTFGNFLYPPGGQHVETTLRRGVGYVYDYLNVFDTLWLIGGLSYDWLSYPENIDLPPVSDRQLDKDKISPKGGIVWVPGNDLVLRAAYTRSLGGLYFDNSVRLEPAQVAGFEQAFRSLAPESVAGLATGTEFETGNLDLSWRLPTDTYVGLGGEWLRSEAQRHAGMFDSTGSSPIVTLFSAAQNIDFEEKSLIANLNQLCGRDWAFGAHYRLSKATLQERMPEVPASALSTASMDDTAILHQLALQANFAHPSGFFAEVEALWFAQDNQDVPDADFWQFNVFGGYRLWQRRIEFMIGGLNLGDQDYRLDPLNLHAELPRHRTFLVSFKFNF